MATAKERHMHEKKLANCGLMMEIIAYRSYRDIDVKFENGSIRRNRTYNSFKIGEIRPEKIATDGRVGETKIAKNGMKMTIIAYRNAQRGGIDVKFEDGTVRKNVTYTAFKNGNVKNPNIKKESPNSKKVGLISTHRTGVKMKLIAYRNSHDVDVEFDDKDKTVVKGTSFSNFKNGTVRYRKSTVGETSVHKRTGMVMTVIADRGCTDIDIKFEDGTVVTNRTWRSFQKGEIAIKREPLVGKTCKAKSGIHYTIVSREKGTSKYLIRFEDGVEKVCTGSPLNNNEVKHPTLNVSYGRSTRKNVKGHIFNFKIIGLAYETDGDTNYICQCKECRVKDILTINEMRNHKCEIEEV